MKKDSKCIKCPQGTYNQEDGGIECNICPEFTFPSKKRDRCDIADIIHNKAFLKRYNLNILDQKQKILCKNKKFSCSESFIGKNIPFSKRENTKIYLSPKKASILQINDSLGKNVESNNIGHIFAFFDNKTIKNLGKKVEYIKIIEDKVKKGLLIKYSDGDICEDNPNLRYYSYLLINCNKTNEEAFTDYFSNNCSFIIEWKTNVGCMNCLLSQTNTETSSCLNSSKIVKFKENEDCKILDRVDSIFSYPNYSTGNSSFITKEDIEMDEILYIFFEEGKNIKGIPNEIINDISKSNRNYYIEGLLLKEDCTILEIIKSTPLYGIVIASLVYILFIIILVKIICNIVRNKVKGLKDTKISNATNVSKFNDQLELVQNDS